jgi:hypothetical protein
MNRFVRNALYLALVCALLLIASPVAAVEPVENPAPNEYTGVVMKIQDGTGKISTSALCLSFLCLSSVSVSLRVVYVFGISHVCIGRACSDCSGSGVPAQCLTVV